MVVGGINVDLVQKNIKNIHLAVYPPDGRVRLAAPINVNKNTLQLFVTSKIPWIRRQQRKFASQERQSCRQYIDRETHYFFGKKCLLMVHEVNNVHRYPMVEKRFANFIDMYVKPGSIVEQKQELMKEWYRAELKKVLPDLVKKWEKIIGVKAKSYTIKAMRTKWGSCNTNTGSVNLNLELAKKPVQCIEYVLAHELVHLIERKHNDVFQHYMTKHLPKWRKLRGELNSLPVGLHGITDKTINNI
jgi:hypothetical protein